MCNALCLNCLDVFNDSLTNPCCACPVEKRAATLEEAHAILAARRQMGYKSAGGAMSASG